MSSTKTLTSFVDAEVKQAHASSNFGRAAKISVNGGGSSDIRRSYLYVSRPFPLGATILSATLRLHLAGAWSGTNNLTAKRITTKWAESSVNYNTSITTTSTHSASATVTGGSDGQTVDFDVTNMLQDVSGGGTFYGWQIALSQHATRSFYSSEYTKSAYRPQLIIQWSVPPNAPDRLAPDGDPDNTPLAGDAVSVQFPYLTWNFTDGDSVTGTSNQTAYQVQLSLDGTFTSPAYDTGKITDTQSLYDTNDGTFAGLSNGDVYYWRVRVYDDANLVSPWSETAVFNRTNLQSLTISSPSSTTDDTSPTVVWTFGGTAKRWQVTLWETTASGTEKTLLWTGVSSPATAGDTAVTIADHSPPYVRSGRYYKVWVSVWDDVVRAVNEAAVAHQSFTYVPSGTPSAVATLTATAVHDANGGTMPAIQFDFTRSSAPDYWALVADGVEVEARIDISDSHVSGTSYRIIYWGATPRQATTYEVQAVELSSGRYKHSTSNPTVSFQTSPVAIWLANAPSPPTKDVGDAVAIYGNDAVDLQIGEVGTTFNLIGARAPVRILDIVRGYEGTVAGKLLSATDRDTLLALKGLFTSLQLIIGDLSLPITLEDTHVSPTPSPGDLDYAVSFTFFQTGAPWPVDLLG